MDSNLPYQKYLEELSEISETEYTCPVCHQDQLSSLPVSPNDSYRYSYSKNRGLEVAFRIKNNYKTYCGKVNFNYSFAILI